MDELTLQDQEDAAIELLWDSFVSLAKGNLRIFPPAWFSASWDLVITQNLNMKVAPDKFDEIVDCVKEVYKEDWKDRYTCKEPNV